MMRAFSYQHTGDIVLVRIDEKSATTLVQSFLRGKNTNCSHVLVCVSSGLWLHAMPQEGVDLIKAEYMRNILSVESPDSFSVRRHPALNSFELYWPFLRSAQYHYGKNYHSQLMFNRSDTVAFCSQLVALIYRDIGIQFDSDPQEILPIDVDEQTSNEFSPWKDVTKNYLDHLQEREDVGIPSRLKERISGLSVHNLSSGPGPLLKEIYEDCPEQGDKAATALIEAVAPLKKHDADSRDSFIQVAKTIFSNATATEEMTLLLNKYDSTLDELVDGNTDLASDDLPRQGVQRVSFYQRIRYFEELIWRLDVISNPPNSMLPDDTSWLTRNAPELKYRDPELFLETTKEDLDTTRNTFRKFFERSLAFLETTLTVPNLTDADREQAKTLMEIIDFIEQYDSYESDLETGLKLLRVRECNCSLRREQTRDVLNSLLLEIRCRMKLKEGTLHRAIQTCFQETRDINILRLGLTAAEELIQDLG